MWHDVDSYLGSYEQDFSLNEFWSDEHNMEVIYLGKMWAKSFIV